MSLFRNRQWPIYLVLVAIAGVLLYLGRRHMMLLEYNRFLGVLGALALALVVVAWRTGSAIPLDGAATSEGYARGEADEA
jgi:hypothetical protein